jgi:DNA helicase-2/ATP-dependent DNA helicase PcrA
VALAPRHSEARASGNPSHPVSAILAQLDDDQRAAASCVEGPLLIIAGPGSGKTRTLTHRIAHLVADCGVAAANCLAITFTRRAAAEMRERLAHLMPDGADQVAIHTFHSFGLSLLREHPAAAGLHRGFRVASVAERTALLAQTLDVTATKAERLVRAISRAKRAPSTASEEVAEALAAYQRALALGNMIDFDDLIALPVRALEADPGLAACYRARFPHICVDEFQDVDEQQYRFLALIGPLNPCVIGDPDQAIYGFRGADASCFDRFRRDYPAAKVVSLARNYRSSGTIVTAAAQVIAARRERSVTEIVREMHERITIHVAPTEPAEAEAVVAAIEHMIGGATFFSMDSARASGVAERSYSFADFAVLYRTVAQAAALTEAFARSGMPFKQAAHGALAGDPAVQALLGQLGDGDGPIADGLRCAAERLQGADGIDPPALSAALARLTALAEACGQDRARFLDAMALATDADFFDARADRVSLLTLHAAKGLEFPVVFIVGLEDGILPLHWSAPDEAALAEERRLFYVGMTRAKDRLILSRARKRLWRGRMRELEASPFLSDIEAELLKHQRAELPRRKPEDRQLSLF